MPFQYKMVQSICYKLWLSGFSCSPWMVLNQRAQAFSTKTTGARRMAMMNGQALWLWQMYPNTLSGTSSTCSIPDQRSSGPERCRVLLRASCGHGTILEEGAVSVWCYFVYIFPPAKQVTGASQGHVQRYLDWEGEGSSYFAPTFSAFKHPTYIENQFRMLNVIAFLKDMLFSQVKWTDIKNEKLLLWWS